MDIDLTEGNRLGQVAFLKSLLQHFHREHAIVLLSVSLAGDDLKAGWYVRYSNRGLSACQPINAQIRGQDFTVARLPAAECRRLMRRTHEVAAHHDHASHPEKQDVKAGDQQRGRVTFPSPAYFPAIPES